VGVGSKLSGGPDAAAVAEGGVKRDDGVIRRRMGVMSSGNPIVVIAQGSPCWLLTLLSFDLPVRSVFMAWQYWGMLSEMEKKDTCKDLEELSKMDHWPADWD
jgi:hypothetical protein